jgi:uncharacterized membrane protein
MKVGKGAEMDRQLPSTPDRMVLAAQIRSHRGPLPSPEWLAEMEELHPGAVEMILRDFTEERRHLREMERKGIELNTSVAQDLGSYQSRRLSIAGGLAFFLVACGLALILLNKALYGFVLLVAEISTLVAVIMAQRAWPADEDLDLSDREEPDRSTE